MTLAVFLTDPAFRNALYITAFSLFVVGLLGLTGPRGNRIAAARMAIAIVVNPDVRSNPASPLYGMPILDVDQARSIIVLKRSMRSGAVAHPVATT